VHVSAYECIGVHLSTPKFKFGCISGKLGASECNLECMFRVRECSWVQFRVQICTDECSFKNVNQLKKPTIFSLIFILEDDKCYIS